MSYPTALVGRQQHSPMVQVQFFWPGLGSKRAKSLRFHQIVQESTRSGSATVMFPRCHSGESCAFSVQCPRLWASAVTRWVNARGKKKGSTGRGGIPGDPKLRGACLMCDSHPSTKPVPVQRHRCEIDTPFRLTKAALLQRRRQRQDSPGLLSVQRS